MEKGREALIRGLRRSGMGVARTVDGARRLFALRHGGAEPSRRPGPACRWCPLLDECEQGQAHHRDDAD